MAAALATWGKRLAAAELRRAMADPNRYAGVKKGSDLSSMSAIDREIATILLRFGMRRAADVANKAAGEVIFTGSMLRDAIAGKVRKAKNGTIRVKVVGSRTVLVIVTQYAKGTKDYEPFKRVKKYRVKP